MKQLTVKELIAKLQQLPQDALVESYVWSDDVWSDDARTEVTMAEYDEEDNTVTVGDRRA